MNPFSYGAIVRGGHFYDRKEECAHLVKTLSGGNNIVLYAPRRFGKTSLVFKVIEQLEKQRFLCVYFDFMMAFSPESFVRLYTKALSAKQTNLKKFAQTFATAIKSIRPMLSFGMDGTPEFSIDYANATINETVISQLLDMPETLADAGKRVIVFFDEFQEVERLSSINFEGLLRSKIQQQRNTNYLFLGSKTHLLKELFNNKKRAFYNAASQMTIGSLPQQDTIKYLRKKFAESGITLNTTMAKYMISVASDIPHYIQLLAAETWQYMVNSRKLVTKKIIDDCVARMLAFKSDYYIELFDRQSQSQKQLLQALALEGKNIFSTAYIRAHRLPSASTLQRAVKELFKEGIIEKANDEYFIADPFFKRFITSIY
ncbi:MAG: ATP-binding protein [Prevotellaceae bacterium]|jgi:AAA+ ATPase superfamily predicted ATPase|nr:ATP-binding protein [Prevotellaceae bacterium]